LPLCGRGDRKHYEIGSGGDTNALPLLVAAAATVLIGVPLMLKLKTR